jgi:TonB family protein
MLDVLIASGARPQLQARWLTTSTLTHGLIISLAVLATRSALEHTRPAAMDQAILLFVPKPPPPALEVKHEPAPAVVSVAEPPPKGFQTVVAPQDIPQVIPPVDLGQRPLDPRDFTGRGVEGGIAAGVVGGTGVVDPGELGDANAIYEATLQDDRFQPAIMVVPPEPKYPKLADAIGIEGRVSLEFVIDTLGRVEPASILILQSTHEVFDSSARAAIAKAAFRPARLSSHPVRQLTRESIRYVQTH